MKRNKEQEAAARTAMGQILDVGLKLLAKVVTKVKARGVDIGEAFSRLAGAEGESILEKIADLIAGTGDAFLRLISGKPLIIGPTDGPEIIAKTSGVFAFIDPNFKSWKADEPGVATKETPTLVYEMANNATYTQMFGSLSPDVAKLCLTQAQIKAFVEQHRDWLQTDGHATFFLFKSYEQFFVVGVCVDSGGELEVHVRPFEGSDVWSAEYHRRLVVPQLA